VSSAAVVLLTHSRSSALCVLLQLRNQRRLVHILVTKGLMTELALGDEVRAIYLAQRDMLGEEGAAHMRAWMKQLGCTDIPP
jgi:hypothetical protein